MNIVSSGNQFMIYGDEVKTYSELPPDTYRVTFSKMTGFYLVPYHDLTVTEKVYGPYKRKVDKVLNTFAALERNMGVILSGPKGVGKSMFARLLAERGRKLNLPLIVVDYAYPAIENFISSIEQECIILFDEFEKVFKKADKDNDEDAQENLLSLFDGLDTGKKLYIITCNNTSNLNSYLLNRPGRFHYHFVMGSPSKEEVREYMNDNLKNDARRFIDKIVSLSGIAEFTYDILRAIAFELNQGYDLSESMTDLNIERNRYFELNMEVIFSNGVRVVSREPFTIDFKGEYARIWCFISKEQKKKLPKEIMSNVDAVGINFMTNSINLSENGYILNPKEVTYKWDLNDEYLDDTIPREKVQKDLLDQFVESCGEVTKIKLIPVYQKDFYRKWLI